MLIVKFFSNGQGSNKVLRGLVGSMEEGGNLDEEY